LAAEYLIQDRVDDLQLQELADNLFDDLLRNVL